MTTLNAVPPGPREFDPGPLPRPRGDPAALGRPTPAVSVWRQSEGRLEPGKRLSRGTSAQSHPSVHQGGRGLGVGPDAGASEDELPGRDPAAGVEDGLDEEAAHGGGADAGDVDKGGDVFHQGQHRGEMVPPQWSGPTPGHAQIHDRHQGVAWIWIHAVRRGGRSSRLFFTDGAGQITASQVASPKQTLDHVYDVSVFCVFLVQRRRLPSRSMVERER